MTVLDHREQRRRGGARLEASVLENPKKEDVGPLVPQLLLQHSSAVRKRAVGLTYAYWSTSVEHSSLLTTIPQPNSETVPEVLASVKCSSNPE